VIEFRQAVESDVDALIALTRATLDATHRAFLGDAAVDNFITGGACDRYLADEVGRCTVMLLDGQLIGYTVWKRNLIDTIMVDHRRHRQGLGGQLLEYSEQALFRIYDELALESFEDNAQANNFYRKHGWTEARTFYDEQLRRYKIAFRKARPG
jgi:GNAT superfamily N-acetyltransferase